jgi:hypothetical protein
MADRDEIRRGEEAARSAAEILHEIAKAADVRPVDVILTRAVVDLHKRQVEGWKLVSDTIEELVSNLTERHGIVDENIERLTELADAQIETEGKILAGLAAIAVRIDRIERFVGMKLEPKETTWD